MSDIFVSYKAEDRPRVEPLVSALEAEGLSIWWDARVGGGEPWREAIAEHLDAAQCVIVIWSKRSTGPEGRFVRDEASHAQHRGTYLPVTIDKVQPPLGFGEMQALSLIGWKGDASDPRYRAISACAHSMLGRKASDHAPRGRAPLVTRRTALAASGVAVVAAGIGAAGWLLLRPDRAKANTVAVLPFANLSGDPSQNYFSDGMAEEVRSALAAAGNLQVVARTSSEMLRNADAVTAARRLDVANVITGSIRRSPSTVRVSAQLVDGSSGLERWSQTFDRPPGDVLRIESDIAANVAKALSVEFGSRRSVAGSLGRTTNAQAQDLVLQATATEGADDSEALLRRIALFDKAIRLDPNYAEAHARKGLTQAIWSASWARNAAEKDRGEGQAAQSVRRAIGIAPAMPLGYTALGILYHDQLAMRQSLEAFKRAVDLPGADAAAFLNYALVLSQMRKQAEAESTIGHAISLDPLNPVARQFQSLILLWDRRYPESIDAARRTLQIAPENHRARNILAWNLMFLGRYDEARSELQKVPADDYLRLVAEATMAGRTGHQEDALRAIRAIEQRYADAANYQYAEIYAQLGMKKEAIAALDAAWRTRDSGLANVQVDILIDPARSDPRYAEIVARVFG